MNYDFIEGLTEEQIIALYNQEFDEDDKISSCNTSLYIVCGNGYRTYLRTNVPCLDWNGLTNNYFDTRADGNAVCTRSSWGKCGSSGCYIYGCCNSTGVCDGRYERHNR